MESCSNHSAHERAIMQYDKRLDNHGAQLDKLNETLAALKEIERQNQERLDGHEARISALEAVPGKRWETIATQALIAAVGLAAGYAAGNIGL